MVRPTRTAAVATAWPERVPSVRALAAVWCVVAASAVQALTPADLQPSVREELARTGLVSAAAAVPTFRWVYENKRPMRHVRSIDEAFAASADGLSLVERAVRYDDGKVDRDENLSARGLLRVDGRDHSLGVHIRGLRLPPQPGERFEIESSRDGHPVRESCVVGARAPAAEVFAALPGDAIAIECRGEGRYAGIKVRASSLVYYFERLGVFFSRRDVLDTPLGKFENTNRIIDFKLGTD